MSRLFIMGLCTSLSVCYSTEKDLSLNLGLVKAVPEQFVNGKSGKIQKYLELVSTGSAALLCLFTLKVSTVTVAQ